MADFPLRKKINNMGLKHWILPKNHFKTLIFFFNFWVGGTIFSSDPDPKGGSNLKALWRSHLTSVRWPISYRIRFMARRSFLFYFCFLPLRGVGVGHALCGKFHYCQKIGTTTGVVVGLRSGSRLTTTIVDLYFHDFYPWIFLSIFFASLRFCLKKYLFSPEMLVKFGRVLPLG